MVRISRNLICAGIENGTISFGMEDNLLVAKIGDNWFFISSDFDKTEEDYLFEQLVNMIYESVNAEPINDDEEESAGECLYYKTILIESIGGFKNNGNIKWNHEWKNAKQKHYFFAKMMNGGKKVVYMCFAQAAYMEQCTNLTYKKI